MTAIQAYTAGDARVSPALSSHLARHRTPGLLPRHAPEGRAALVPALVAARRLGAVVLDWPARSQRRAVRNAMVASTALVERRVERDEVDAFLRDHASRQDASRHSDHG